MTARRNLSSMKQVGLYLANEVKAGNKFTMLQIREAVPGINQIDRRVRDLRPYGWVIRAYKDHPGLRPEEYLLEKIGDPVWQDDTRAKSPRIGGRTRRDVFERDGRRCVICGVAAGEAYPDVPGSAARLTIGHWTPRDRGGSDAIDNLRTECARCNEESRHLTTNPQDLETVWARIKELSRSDRRELLSWMVNGKRNWEEVDILWSLYRQLPAPQRKEVSDRLVQMV